LKVARESNWHMSRFTGRAHEHEGKFIKLIVLLYSVLTDVGPAHSLIPWCSASVQIGGKPATDPLNRDIS
jgi:hypothetical protein